jgi:Flp pilus assembly protein TadD
MAVKDYLAAAENRYANVQLVLPRAAEKVFIKGHTPEAVVVAQAVSEVLPKTIDAWVVLAYVALKKGDKPLAARAAQQALVLDPNNRTARDLLEEATGKAA